MWGSDSSRCARKPRVSWLPTPTSATAGPDNAVNVTSLVRLVPDDFPVPGELQAGGFRLVPIGPEHNAADYEAWTSSIAHIRSTPGFVGASWPSEAMGLDQNLADLERHARDAAHRTGFTFTVLAPHGGAIGCVYIYPPRRRGYDVEVRSWVRASHAHLDADLYHVVSEWLAEAWPFRHPDYATRGDG
jgi:hypothetical protein